MGAAQGALTIQAIVFVQSAVTRETVSSGVLRFVSLAFLGGYGIFEQYVNFGLCARRGLTQGGVLQRRTPSGAAPAVRTHSLASEGECFPPRLRGGACAGGGVRP